MKTKAAVILLLLLYIMAVFTSFSTALTFIATEKYISRNMHCSMHQQGLVLCSGAPEYKAAENKLTGPCSGITTVVTTPCHYLHMH